jgi:hypothetical protein
VAWIALLLALVSGWLLVSRLDPARGLHPRWAVTLLNASLGAGLGMAVLSVSYFLMLLAGVASAGAVLGFHFALVAALGFVAWRARSQAAGAPENPPAGMGRGALWLALALAVVLLLVVVAEVRITSANPHGLWDAWSIWNIRAKFLAGPGEAWRYALSPLLGRTHPDYPLLLSGLVGAAWRAGGEMSPAVPATITYLFPLAAAGVLLSGLTLLRSVHLGLLALIVLVSDREYLTHISGQMSDVPLGFYYVGAIVCFLLSLETRGKPPLVLVLAGALASIAAWTKDEGVAFLVVFFGCAAGFELWNGRVQALWRRYAWLVVGAIPGAVLVAALKLFLAPHANQMISQAPSGAAFHLFSAHRWTNLFLGIWSNFEMRGHGLLHPALTLGVAVLALGFGVPARCRKPAVFLSVMTAGLFGAYCAAILANPAMLGTQWVMPMDRMFSQLWPSVLLLAMSVVRPWPSPAPHAAPAAAEAPAAGKKKCRASRH